MAKHRATEVINGYDIELLARALYDARTSRVSGPCTDEEWERHAIRFPSSHRILMADARREARND